MPSTSSVQGWGREKSYGQWSVYGIPNNYSNTLRFSQGIVDLLVLLYFYTAAMLQH